MKSALLLGSLVALLGVSVAAVNFGRSTSPTVDWQVIQVPAREVTLDKPSRGPIVETISAPGTVEPVEEAEIASQLVGRVVEVRVKDGDRVKKGDLLVRLDETEARARLDSAIARIERLKASQFKADTDLAKAMRDLRRIESLARRDVSTPTELADAQSELARAQAGVAICKQELVESEALQRTSQQELERTSILAPIDGVVAGCEVEVGEVVIAGTTNLPGTVLMTVADLEHMQVRADVDETDVRRVQTGEPARIFLQADLLTSIPGTVDRVAPKGTLEADVVSFETLIRVDDSRVRQLRSGMNATVEIEVDRRAEALRVPVQAVVHRRKKDLPDTPAVREWVARNSQVPGEAARDSESRYVKIVFVEQAGVARARPVETGLSDEQFVEIASGLEPNERVVVGPFRTLDELKDGDPVTEARAAVGTDAKTAP